MPALMIQAPDQASPALHAALYAEWQKFRDGTAPVDPEYIPPFILASWERCRESGITTEANSIVRVDALLLEQAQRLNSDLLCSARSIMDKLFSVVRATRCSISLTDGSGLVLHTLRSEGDGPDVLPGQIATEAVSGTNGIGTTFEPPPKIVVCQPRPFATLSASRISSNEATSTQASALARR